MAAVDDVNELIEQYDLALGESVKGNPEPVKELFSRREDVTIANPLCPVGHGWEQVAERLERAERAASTLRDGEITSLETVEKHVTPELAYVVRVERQEGKVGGGEDVASFALRVRTTSSAGVRLPATCGSVPPRTPLPQPLQRREARSSRQILGGPRLGPAPRSLSGYPSCSGWSRPRDREPRCPPAPRGRPRPASRSPAPRRPAASDGRATVRRGRARAGRSR